MQVEPFSSSHVDVEASVRNRQGRNEQVVETREAPAEVRCSGSSGTASYHQLAGSRAQPPRIAALQVGHDVLSA
jgi:hypothetical protein